MHQQRGRNSSTHIAQGLKPSSSPMARVKIGRPSAEALMLPKRPRFTLVEARSRRSIRASSSFPRPSAPSNPTSTWPSRTNVGTPEPECRPAGSSSAGRRSRRDRIRAAAAAPWIPGRSFCSSGRKALAAAQWGTALTHEHLKFCSPTPGWAVAGSGASASASSRPSSMASTCCSHQPFRGLRIVSSST